MVQSNSLALMLPSTLRSTQLEIGVHQNQNPTASVVLVEDHLAPSWLTVVHTVAEQTRVDTRSFEIELFSSINVQLVLRKRSTNSIAAAVVLVAEPALGDLIHQLIRAG